jgi:hypothetical protein
MAYVPLLTACFVVCYGLPPQLEKPQGDSPSTDASNMFGLLNQKIRILDSRLDVDYRILKSEMRRDMGQSCTACRSSGSNISGLRFDIQKLQMDMKQMWAGHKLQEQALQEYITNQTQPLDQLDSIMEVVHNTSGELYHIREQMAFLSARISMATHRPPVTTSPP